MFLFSTPPPNEFEAEGQKLLEVFQSAKAAFASAMDPNQLTEDLTGLEGIAIKLQRSMGGVVVDAEGFRDTMLDTLKNTIDVNANMTDVKETIEGLGSSMGRMVNYQTETLTAMIEFSKATGMSEKDVGAMVGELTRFGGTIAENVARMSDFSKSARKSGLDAKTFTAEIGKNMKIASGFGFKNGVKGIESMVKQASMLRTTMDKINAKGFADGILDPEKAIEAAAGFQMLGGAVGKLSDPFQLMHMAQTDMAGLQKEMINATKSAFSFNKETGGFEASTEDLYRLREQSKLTGQNFDEMLESGKEAAKIDFLKDKFGLGNFTQEEQDMIAGLTEVGKGGKVELKIPGLERTLTANSAEELASQLKNNDVQAKLKEYQQKAGQSERELAIKQMSISENQAKDIMAIRYMMLTGMDQDKRDRVTKNLGTGADDIMEAYKSVGGIFKDEIATGAESIITLGSNVSKDIKSYYGIDPDDKDVRNQRKIEIQNAIGEAGSGTGEEAGIFDSTKTVTVKTRDMIFSPNTAPTLMSEGKIYEGIVGDEVIFGTNLTEAFNKTGELNKVMSQILSSPQSSEIGGITNLSEIFNKISSSLNSSSPQSSEIGGITNLSEIFNKISSSLNDTSTKKESTSVDGKIDININLNGSISGDNGAIEKMLNDTRFKNQIMETILYKLDDFKKQQGVIA